MGFILGITILVFLAAWLIGGLLFDVGFVEAIAILFEAIFFTFLIALGLYLVSSGW